MAYIDSFNLSQDSTFKGRVTIAITTAASQIYGETPSGNANLDRNRASLALAVLRSPTGYADIFAIAVCTNPVINVSSTDSDIQFTVNSVWNDIAGV